MMKAVFSFANLIYILVIAICILLDISSCNSGKAQSTMSVSGSNEAASKEVQVVMEKMAFHPDTVTVVKGTKVTWTDKQSFIPHNVISDTKGLFDSGNMHKNDTFSYTFNDTGTFNYYCSHHKKMRGTVIVK